MEKKHPITTLVLLLHSSEGGLGLQGCSAVALVADNFLTFTPHTHPRSQPGFSSQMSGGTVERKQLPKSSGDMTRNETKSPLSALQREGERP